MNNGSPTSFLLKDKITFSEKYVAHQRTLQKHQKHKKHPNYQNEFNYNNNDTTETELIPSIIPPITPPIEPITPIEPPIEPPFHIGDHIRISGKIPNIPKEEWVKNNGPTHILDSPLEAPTAGTLKKISEYLLDLFEL